MEVEEKKIKRAAANVNERRRMQNINSGFEALRAILDVQNSSKLSKSAILRHTVDMLRNLVSENQQLREQNTFMRNLYSNYSLPINPSLLQPQPPKLSYNRELLSDLDMTEDALLNPPKKVKFVDNVTENTTKILDVPGQKSAINCPEKSPKKYSHHVSKLLASPKRMTRSSVITQNLAYTSSQSPSQYPVMESPSRRSLRLLEKDGLLTPPSSSEDCNLIKPVTLTDSSGHGPFTNFESPTRRFRSALELRKKELGLTTPESGKHIPVRSAKRSLDAIIQAIDQIEKS